MTQLSCLLLSLFFVLFPNIAELPLVQWAPWIIGIFAFGLAHGGLDDEVALMLGKGNGSRVSRLFFYVCYLGLLVLVLVEWAISPDLALVTFLIFSVFHFGQGDLYWSVYHGSGGAGISLSFRVSFNLRGILFAVTRGALPVLLPLIFRSDQFVRIGHYLVNGNFQTALILPDWCAAHREQLLLLIGTLVGINILVTLLPLLLAGKRVSADWRRAAIAEAGETLLLVILLITTPPILGIGIYFLLWHAPRHVTRLVLADRQMRSIVEKDGGLRAIVHFHKRSFPLVTAATGLLLLVAFACFRSDLSADRLVLPAFIFVNAVTVPHLIVVSLLDRAQKIWRPAVDSQSITKGEVL